MKKNIIIICLDSGVSKTAAKLLAEEQNMFCANINELVDYETSSLTKLKKAKGEKYFLEFEEKLINILSGFDNVVACLNESNILNEKILKQIKENYKIAFLRQTKKEFKKLNADPEDEIVFDELNKLYELYADVVIDIKGRTVDKLTGEIIKNLT